MNALMEIDRYARSHKDVCVDHIDDGLYIHPQTERPKHASWDPICDTRDAVALFAGLALVIAIFLIGAVDFVRAAIDVVRGVVAWL